MSSSDCFCRKASLDDNIEQIAKYIHLTDPYIYPHITRSPSDKSWIRFVSECLKKRDNIFSLENMSVVICDSDIVGIACVIPCQRRLSITRGIHVPEELSQSIPQVVDGYFNPLIEESYVYSGYNIVNVCVDENHRGKGLGSLLMSHCIEEYGSQIMHLDVIASNVSAIRLYKKFDFQIENEYMGYSGDDTLLPCYHMVRSLG